MKRRTSALSVSAAALLVAAAPLLTGCADDSHPGAAAVVGDQKFSVAHVQARVAEVREAQRAEPDGDELIANTASLPRVTVYQLVYQQLVEYAAEEAGIVTKRRDVTETRAREEAQVGGAEELEKVIVRNTLMPLTGDQLDEAVRMVTQRQQLVEALGSVAALEAALIETAERVGVEINPRFGSWNIEEMALDDADLPWLKPENAADTLGE